MAGKLYTYPNNFKAQKIEIAAKYSGYNLELAEFTVGETDKSSDFLKKFPLGKVPAFEENDFYLFEVNAIAYYVGNETTRGGENESEVLQWIGVADNDLLPAACNWVYPTLGILQYNKQATEKAQESVKSVMSLLNVHLLSKTFLVGERVTQADISMACTLLMLYTNVMDPRFREPYGNVNRWFVTLVNQPEFKSVLGNVELCTKMAQFDNKKYQEISGKGKKQSAKKESKPKAEAKKGAGDPPPAQELPAAPKGPTNPWANCPAPSMDLETLKRTYKNQSGDESWKYFLDNFKKEDYSIWIGTYMYNDELKLDFMAGNLARGMLDRLEKLRKNSMAQVYVLKDENSKLEITGFWIWLGQELAFTLCDDWQTDYDTYDWRKLSLDNEDDTKLLRDYWYAEEVKGKEVVSDYVYT